MARQKITAPAVQVGQVWHDNDPRVNVAYDVVVRSLWSTGGIMFAYCEKVMPDGSTLGTVDIRVSRMRPTSNGYRPVRGPGIDS